LTALISWLFAANLSSCWLAPFLQFAASKALAQLAETLGYHRYWLAEHHNMPSIVSAATRADGTANRL
jgi:alkanesulfonate monooxygenase SsuD/methylene tetrahydromethanopterin reductase-like flavin-dependent oxidoreductase (luciferase family)